MIARTWILRVAVTAFALAAASACQSTAQTTGGAACTFGQEIECQGPGGCQGTRTCAPDLSSFGACVCGDGGARDGGTSEAGSRDSGTAG